MSKRELNMKEYITYIILLIIAMLSGAWLNSKLQPIIELEFIQQALVNAVSALLVYVVFVWGYILVTAVFVKEDKNAGELIGIGALVGIPLSIIVGLVISAI